jgi:hypothetical protein
MTHIRYLLLALLVGATICVRGQSDIYQKYAVHDELYVAYVPKFPLDSTTTVAVTVIQAHDTAGWAWMCKEFNIYDTTGGSGAARQQKMLYCLRDKADPTQPATMVAGNVDYSRCCPLFASPVNYSVCIFHVTSRDEIIKVFEFRLKLLKDEKNKSRIIR